MDSVLRTGLRIFGRNLETDENGDEVDNRIIYTRSGYDPFRMVAVPDIIPHLESVNVGKFYSVSMRVKDFDDSPLTAFVQVTFNGVPNNHGTLTLDGIVYTFQTTLDDSVAYNVAKGANATESAANMVAAINAGAGAGTAYSSPTEAHPTCTATQLVTNTNVCRVDYNITGSAGNGIVAQEAANYVVLSSKVFQGGGPLLGDLITFNGLVYNTTDIGYDSEGAVKLRLELKSL
jgi:hypothetical protein